MQYLSQFTSSLSLSEDAKESVSRILSNVDESIADAWSKTVEVKDGRIRSTFYRDIGSILSFNDFVSLYENLGYDFSTMATWKDWKCGHGGCVRTDGWSCNTDTCT